MTSKGDIEIELWCKECPKACRNFIGLGMEGYYEGTTFHRVVPGLRQEHWREHPGFNSLLTATLQTPSVPVAGFIVQGGDPTGTGHGGESIYGKPFKVSTDRLPSEGFLKKYWCILPSFIFCRIFSLTSYIFSDC